MKQSGLFKETEKFIYSLQNEICGKLEALDNNVFIEDKWKHSEDGGGITRVISNGEIFEKGGVNTSSVGGELPENFSKQLKVKRGAFSACGISIVIHPYSPKIPTIHMNVRYFETENSGSWFGGGIDLTPYYPQTDDFKFFHNTLKSACNSVIPGSYAEYKKECDEYFTVKHRNEMRGIGGIFFDYLDGRDRKNFDLIKSIGNSFMEIYLPIIEKRKNEPFNSDDKKFQLIRRGRYVEFNLIYDRGTLFGLQTGGRIESILMSMPPEVIFPYNWQPEQGTPQYEMMKYYQPTDWGI